MEVDTDYIPAAAAVGIHCSKLEDDLENAEEVVAVVENQIELLQLV